MQNPDIFKEVIEFILNELSKVFQTMLQTTSSSQFPKEEKKKLKENIENIKVLIQENNNVFKRVCSVLNSIIILKENIVVIHIESLII